MLSESIELLVPERTRATRATFVDATFGAGGHTRAILAYAPASRVVAFDADPAAFGRARALQADYPDRLIPVHANFAELDERLSQIGLGEVDGIMYDLGLSSLQYADPTRGFSFAGNEPLDMRLDPSGGGQSAADLLAELSEAQLGDLIRTYGDERYGRRIAHQITTRRRRSPLRSTADLVAAVLSARPRDARRARIHPATRTFQALRIAVNRELERLEQSLVAARRRLRPGGRAVAITFHSGEDRIVKHAFAQWVRDGAALALMKKPMLPSPQEIAENPRSRSAKLRAVEKIGEDEWH